MDFIRAQLSKIPAVAPVNLSACTVLITGSNTGLGLEAARQFLPSKPKRLILAVRNVEKGNEVKAELEKAKAPSTEIEVRKLDQSSFASVSSFAKGLKGDRVDLAILNAGKFMYTTAAKVHAMEPNRDDVLTTASSTGVWNTRFQVTEDGCESDLQVNTLAPALLSILLIPNLRTASKAPVENNAPRPHLVFVSSGLHEMAKFPERMLPSGQVLATLNDPKKYTKQDRYPTTKTIGLLWARELAARVPSSEVTINSSSPGFCSTGIMRNTAGIMGYGVKMAEKLLGRSPPDGAKCLVNAAIAQGPETHGKFLSECQIKPESPLVKGPEGKDLQGKMWKEIVGLLAKHGLDEKSLP